MTPITFELTRRLALYKQRLAGPRPPADAASLLATVQSLGGVQLDPTNAVARSHLLVLWSRLGRYDSADLETLLWRERQLFEYRAFLRPVADYPLYRHRMAHFPDGRTAWPTRVRDWLAANEPFAAYILEELRQRGPLLSRALEDRSLRPWQSGGWTSSRNVGQMLEFLAAQGRIMIAGRRGGQRLWDLPERCLPPWVSREPVTAEQYRREMAERGVRTRGLAHLQDLARPLAAALPELAKQGRLVTVTVDDDVWYLHADDLPLLERLAAGEWQPRTTLLSPFDNLIADRERTARLFGFHFRLEIYVPEAKRQYGYFVLPILRGDRLIGRIDPRMDYRRRVLTVNAVYAEPDAPQTAETGWAVAAAIGDLAAFLGAEEIVYGENVPDGWREALPPPPAA